MVRERQSLQEFERTGHQGGLVGCREQAQHHESLGLSVDNANYCFFFDAHGAAGLLKRYLTNGHRGAIDNGNPISHIDEMVGNAPRYCRNRRRIESGGSGKFELAMIILREH
jgi:hypothetical protein